jgi:ribosome recycling factor
MVEGQLIRVPLPPLTEERRKELVKLAHKFAEHARVAVRNVRRDGMETLKQMEKDHKITEDEHRKRSGDIQKLTDEQIKIIDDTLAAKEKETMHV